MGACAAVDNPVGGHMASRIWPMLALGVSAVLIASMGSGYAQTKGKMWYIGIDMCATATPDKCVKGILEKDSPKYISKTECERGAQQFISNMQRQGLKINRVWCEELLR